MNESSFSHRTLGDLIDTHVIQVTTGFPFGGHNSNGDGEVHIRPFNVGTDGAIHLEQIKSIPIDAASEKPRLQKGDIVFNNTNTKELAGKCALWSSEERFVFSNHMTRIRPLKNSVDPAYLSFAIFHHWTTGKSEMLARSHVAQASIIGARFREIEVPWPRVVEQKSIGQLLSQVQKARRTETSQHELACKLKTATMRQLFTRGLRREAQKDTEFGAVPTSWKIDALDNVAIVQTGAAKGRKLADTDTIEVPYLRVANVQDGHLDLREMKTIQIRRRELNRFRLEDGDVVLTEGGDFDKLGRGFIWRSELEVCVHQNHVFAVRANRHLLLPEFLAYLAQSAYGKAYFLRVAHKTTNLACINSTKLKAFPVLLPAHNEQREIVAILDAIDRKIVLHQKKQTVLEALFHSLLHKLMTGEISVDDLDLSALTPEEPQSKTEAELQS